MNILKTDNTGRCEFYDITQQCFNSDLHTKSTVKYSKSKGIEIIIVGKTDRMLTHTKRKKHKQVIQRIRTDKL